MSQLRITQILATLCMAGLLALPARAESEREPTGLQEISFLRLDHEILLRRMLVRHRNPKGIVLFLHGFPETLYAWQPVSALLSADYEIHAFDWPGFGLSSRPSIDKFAYGPRDLARVVNGYVEKAGIDRSKLIIYATDIGGLPALLAALDNPGLAHLIIVGDFAPFDRPQYMHQRLQSLKSKSTHKKARAELNAARDDVIENATRRGLASHEQFALDPAFIEDMRKGWAHGALTTADAFAEYYAQFTRDQNYLEANLSRLTTPVKVVWGERDIYIDKAMGAEFARRLNVKLSLFPGIAHYPHLQAPETIATEIRAALP